MGAMGEMVDMDETAQRPNGRINMIPPPPGKFIKKPRLNGNYDSTKTPPKRTPYQHHTYQNGGLRKIGGQLEYRENENGASNSRDDAATHPTWTQRPRNAKRQA